MRRASALLLLMAVSASNAALCTGWSNSLAERMACCERRAGNCSGGSLSADDCCADGEQRQNAERLAVLIVAPPVHAEALALLRSANESAAVPVAPPIDGHNTYLFDSVFRI